MDIVATVKKGASWADDRVEDVSDMVCASTCKNVKIGVYVVMALMMVMLFRKLMMRGY